MLILSRKLNESIVIDGRIVVRVMRVDGDVVKLGIAAPAEVPVHRQEVYEEIRRSNEAAVTQRMGAVPRLSPRAAARPHSDPDQADQPHADTEVQNTKSRQVKKTESNSI